MIKILHNDGPWDKPGDLTEANALAKATPQYLVSPVTAARYIEVQMRDNKAHLGGVYCTPNEGQAMNSHPTNSDAFILGDLMVIDPASTPRFDEMMTLKEDYDLTAQHLAKYGAVARSNRVVIRAAHYTNAGGAVADRTDSKEQYNIGVLRHKWPGAFPQHTTRGVNEVNMRWGSRSDILGGKKDVPRPECPVWNETLWKGELVTFTSDGYTSTITEGGTKRKREEAEEEEVVVVKEARKKTEEPKQIEQKNEAPKQIMEKNEEEDTEIEVKEETKDVQNKSKENAPEELLFPKLGDDWGAMLGDPMPICSPVNLQMPPQPTSTFTSSALEPQERMTSSSACKQCMQPSMKTKHTCAKGANKPVVYPPRDQVLPDGSCRQCMYPSLKAKHTCYKAKNFPVKSPSRKAPVIDVSMCPVCDVCSIICTGNLDAVIDEALKQRCGKSVCEGCSPGFTLGMETGLAMAREAKMTD